MNNFKGTVCYLIGGAPRTGKTTRAYELAKEHVTKPLSTDAIAGIIMETAGRDRYPALFYVRDHQSAESFYRQYDTPERALEVGIAAGRQLEEPIIIVLKRLLPDWRTVILEGVAITPAFVERLERAFPETDFRVTFLYDKTGKHIEENIYAKGLWRRDESYSDDVKPNEIAYAQVFNEWIYDEALKYNQEIITF